MGADNSLQEGKCQKQKPRLLAAKNKFLLKKDGVIGLTMRGPNGAGDFRVRVIVDTYSQEK